MTPRAFTNSDIDYTRKLVSAMVDRYPTATSGFNLIVVESADDTCLEVGSNYIITSEIEDVPSILPRAQWRKQQVYRLTAMWEVYCPHTGSDVAEKDLGTHGSIAAAVSSILLDLVDLDLSNICEGVDYPETVTVQEEV